VSGSAATIAVDQNFVAQIHAASVVVGD